MAKKRRRARQPMTIDGTTLPRPSAQAVTAAPRKTEAGRNMEGAALDFAEDLGRFLGSTQRKAEEWLGQRNALTERLTQIRDAANGYLQQLTGGTNGAGLGETRATRRGRPAGSKVMAAAGSANPSGKRKRRGMTAAQRKAVGERMKKYWAARRKTGGK